VNAPTGAPGAASESRCRRASSTSTASSCWAGPRSLIADLPGDAYCVELRRTAVGPFTVDESASAPLLELDEALERVAAFERDRVPADD
jgi:tRNA pseudouridine55 synthase